MNVLLPVLLQHETSLVAGFEHAIRIAVYEAQTRSKKPCPEEPDYVAMLVLKSVPYIADTLRAVSGPYGIRTTVTSVFCHQKPSVEFNGGKDSCELGDVLLVHRHSSAGARTPRSNALLLQAKMCDTPAYTVPNSESHQLRLYDKWPRFRYVRSGQHLNGQARDIKPKASHFGAQYLLIDGSHAASSGRLGFPGTHCMAVWPTMSTLYSRHSLADVLVRFMTGTTGRPFADDPKQDPTGWSEVVWDLLQHSINFVFNRKNIGAKDASRLEGDPLTSLYTANNFCFVGSEAPSEEPSPEQVRRRLEDLRGTGGPIPPQNSDFIPTDTDSQGGVSVILIETREPDSN